MKFSVKAYSVEKFEQIIEAKDEEEAKKKFIEMWRSDEYEPRDTELFLPDEESFEVVDSLFQEEK